MQAQADIRHFVQFFEEDQNLVDTVVRFATLGFVDGAGVIIAAAQNHIERIEDRLADAGLDLPRLKDRGQLTFVDAEEALKLFMAENLPDPGKFKTTIGLAVSSMLEKFPRVYVYGEMVEMLWRQGNKAAALALENLGVELSRQAPVTILCGYSAGHFKKPSGALIGHEDICHRHSHVLPLNSSVSFEKSAVLEKAEQRFKETQDLLNASPSFFGFVNPKTHALTMCNELSVQLLGKAREDVLGLRFYDCPWWKPLPSSASRVKEAIMRAAEGITSEFDVTYWALGANNENRWVTFRAMPIFDESREVTRIAVSGVEITERKNVEEALARAVQTRDSFMSIASHELKTPLTALKLQAQLRARDLKRGDLSRFASDRLPKLLEDDERQINRLVRLVDDMLDVSRIQTGKLSLFEEEFDLCEVLRDALSRHSAQIETSGSEVRLEIHGNAIGIWDRFRVEQVFVNVLTNALKYGAGRPVLIEAGAKMKQAWFSLTDQGIGIAAKDHERIFGQFERAVSSSDVSGLGLGLFISKKIVEAHGGRITVASEPGKGSTFTVYLP